MEAAATEVERRAGGGGEDVVGARDVGRGEEKTSEGEVVGWAEDTATEVVGVVVAAAEEGETPGVSRAEAAVGEDVCLVICWLVGCCEDCLHS